NDIRKKYLSFFKKNKHVIVDASGLVPADDPSVLFTTAGMQQFKPYFLGKKDPKKDFNSTRLASSQLVFRTSDIESVGDSSHLTLFEMLGNFSIGDYFKKEAIKLAFEFLIQKMHLEKEKMYATYFSGDRNIPADEDTSKLLLKYIPRQRIFPFGKKDNWWGPTGDSGPCGPSAEIHFDNTGKQCKKGDACEPNCECGRFVELWNLVFTEYNQSKTEKLTKLPQKNIDTGLGLERLAMVVQKKNSVFETDLYDPLIKIIEKDINFGKINQYEDERRKRIIADHIKGVFFLLSEGVVFSNKEQGYILRRIFRRASDQYLHPHFNFDELFKSLISMYGSAYPKTGQKFNEVQQVLKGEDEAYRKLLQVSVDEVVEKYVKHSKNYPDYDKTEKKPSRRIMTAQDAFNLYSTYGISPDRLKRKGYDFPIDEFENEVKKHQEKSREGSKSKFGGHGLANVDSGLMTKDEMWNITRNHTATHLLHQALRSILGNHVKQQGSDINTERLRFDFEHPEKLTDKQKKDIEDLVNSEIERDEPVKSKEMPLKDALDSGALSFFREKYPPVVSVYSVGDFSKEICGGPHVDHTKQIGKFTIVSEKSSGAGIRRIKATIADGEEKAPKKAS
ncbi:alanine--tRNA ligase, partial [Patescibacteria group bacterium]